MKSFFKKLIYFLKVFIWFLLIGLLVMYKMKGLAGILLGLVIVSSGVIFAGIVVTLITPNSNNKSMKDKRIVFFDL